MAFFDEIKRQLYVMLHPSSIKSGMSIEDSLKYYYKLSVVPFILFVVLGYAFINTSLFATTFSFLGTGIILNLLSAVLIFWIFVPLGIFIDAALFQLFGKYLFRVYRGEYNDTFTGVTYSVSTGMLLYWLTLLPVLGILILAVLVIWEFIILVVGLSNLNKISRLASFGVLVGSILVVSVILFMLIFAVIFVRLGAHL